MLKNGFIDVAQRRFNVVSALVTDIVLMLYYGENPITDFVSFNNVGSTLFEW